MVLGLLLTMIAGLVLVWQKQQQQRRRRRQPLLASSSKAPVFC